uniref:Immunoglobulin C1-set domain-containing protein n=1 Tax=Amphilophus citrinellus TaxID=61819 RepID=A0A3Q0T271_AMPCI
MIPGDGGYASTVLSYMLLFLHLVSHSLTFFCTESPGAQGIPEFVSVGLVDEVQIVDCNNIRGLEVHKDWIKFFKDDPQHVEWYASQCLNNHHFFKANIESLRQRLNQTEGVHIMQRMCGCEWDDETGELNGFNQFGYDAEDFIALDLQTLTWIAPKPQALITKLSWDTEKARLEANKYILGHECPKYLKKYVQYGKNLLESAVLPSVSLLQKSPSSPISCHATGFYPHRAVMFWRKDGEEIHEGVDHGEILPNNDGTFQMSVDLKLSSVTPGAGKEGPSVRRTSDPGGTMWFSSWSGNTGPALYPLKEIRVCVGVCPTSLHVLCGLGEGIQPCPSGYPVGGPAGVWGVWPVVAGHSVSVQPQ